MCHEQVAGEQRDDDVTNQRWNNPVAALDGV
jgi:hypothetical protein